jgi:hypothetical protein
MTSYLPAKQLPFILSTLVIQDMDSTSIVISKIHLLQKLAIFPGNVLQKNFFFYFLFVYI